MKLSEIEAVARVDAFEKKANFTNEVRYGGERLYSGRQMQEYAEVKRDYILIIDGGIGTKLHATDRFTGTEAVDVYGDKYKVVNHVKNGKMWILDNEEDTKND